MCRRTKIKIEAKFHSFACIWLSNQIHLILRKKVAVARSQWIRFKQVISNWLKSWIGCSPALVWFEKYRFVKEGGFGQLIARGALALASQSIRNCKWCNFFNAFATCTNQPISIIAIIVNVKILCPFERSCMYVWCVIANK